MSGRWRMGSPNSGAMLPTPIHTKQIQAMAGEIYRVAIGRTGFRELYIFCGVPVRQAIGYESRGREFESLWARTSEPKITAAFGPQHGLRGDWSFLKGPDSSSTWIKLRGQRQHLQRHLERPCGAAAIIFTHEESPPGHYFGESRHLDGGDG